jgi:hypothetical protein
MKILLLIICLFFNGCTLFRQETTKESNTVLKNDIVLKGDVAGMPVNLKVSHTGKSQTTEEEKKDTSSPATEEGFGFLSNLVMLLIGGGGAGFIVKKMKDGMIKRMSEGVDSFLEEDPKAGEKLKNHLGRKMDRSDKELIKKVKQK